MNVYMKKITQVENNDNIFNRQLTENTTGFL